MIYWGGRFVSSCIQFGFLYFFTFVNIQVNFKTSNADVQWASQAYASEGVAVDLNVNFRPTAIQCLKLFQDNQTSVGLESTLDCMASQDFLSQIGGQWIVLRKSHWEIQAFSPSATYQLATNFFDPSDKHQLSIKPPTSFSTEKLVEYLVDLQNRIFPFLLNGVTSDGYNHTTKVSFDATAHHYAGLHTASAFYWPKKRTKYDGMVAWSLNSRENLPVLLEKYPYYQEVLDLDPIGTKYWTYFAKSIQARKMRYYQVGNQFIHCDTKCFERQEAHTIGGLFMTLSHGDLVTAVHNVLPRTMGCVPMEIRANEFGVSNYFQNHNINENLYRPTGGPIILNYDFSNWASHGRWGLLGRPLYVRAQISDRVPKSHLGLQGENFIVYNVSDKTARALFEIGGFGAIDSSKDIPKQHKTSYRATVNYLNNFKYEGLSKLMIDYWREISESCGFEKRNIAASPYKMYVYDYGLTGAYYDAVLVGLNKLPKLR